MKVFIIILNFNGVQETLECVASLKKLKISKTSPNLIVIDNNSTDGSQSVLKNIRGIHLIKNRTNLGFSGGNNVGIKYALARKADVVIILNNDTLVDANFLVNILKSLKKADIVSPKIYFAKGFEFHKKRYNKTDLGKVIWYAGGKIDWRNIIGSHIGVDEIDNGQFNKSIDVDFATGAAMLVKRGVFEKIGLFDQKYFLYLEDMDFCVRAKKAGFKIMYEPKAIVWHKNAQSAHGSGSTLQDYFITRNRLLFAFKFANLKTKLAVFKQTLTYLDNPTRRKAFFDFVTLRFNAGTYF